MGTVGWPQRTLRSRFLASGIDTSLCLDGQRITTPSNRDMIPCSRSRNQPILANLVELRSFNDRVDRLSDVVAETHDAIESAVVSAREAEDRGQGDINEAVHEQAMELGSAYRAYVRLKVHSVLEAFS